MPKLGRVKKEEDPKLYEHVNRELSRFSRLLNLDKYSERTKTNVKSVEPLLAALSKDFNPENYNVDSSGRLDFKSKDDLTPTFPSIVLNRVEPQTFVPRNSWYGSFLLHAEYKIIEKDGKKGTLGIDLNDIDADGNVDMVVFDGGYGLDFTLNPDNSVRIDGPFDERYSQDEGHDVISRGQIIYRSLLKDPGVRERFLETRTRLDNYVKESLPEPLKLPESNK